MRPLRSLITVATAGALAVTPVAFSGAVSQAGASTHAATHVTSSRHAHINCANASAMCAEVANSYDVFGHYVGHDEPSVLFNSNVPGSGNHMSYNWCCRRIPRRATPTR